MKASERMKKWISAILCLCMLVQNAPVVAFAATEDNLCDHHSEHSQEVCGYVEAVAGADCTHAHDDACGYVEAVAEVLCACEATDENGAIVHTEGCGYVAPVTGAECTHVHDDACGYVAAVEGHECHYECAECAAAAASEEAPEESSNPAPVCDCGTDEASIHATTCAVYVAPENPVCKCAMKCTEPNEWCDICGFDITACAGQEEMVPYAENSSLWVNGQYVSDSNAADILGDGTAWYVPDENTLYLNGAYISKASYKEAGNRIPCAVMYMGSTPFTIVAEGTNTINTLNNGVDQMGGAGSYGIYSNADLTLKGTGYLNVGGATAIGVEGTLYLGENFGADTQTFNLHLVARTRTGGVFYATRVQYPVDWYDSDEDGTDYTYYDWRNTETGAFVDEDDTPDASRSYFEIVGGGHSEEYTDNGDGTHEVSCSCGAVFYSDEPHDITMPTCFCGVNQAVISDGQFAHNGYAAYMDMAQALKETYASDNHEYIHISNMTLTEDATLSGKDRLYVGGQYTNGYKLIVDGATLTLEEGCYITLYRYQQDSRNSILCVNGGKVIDLGAKFMGVTNGYGDHGHTYTYSKWTYADNGDGTHSYVHDCEDCDLRYYDESEPADHSFGTNGKCVCGLECTHSFTDGVCTVCGVTGGYCGAEDDGTNLVWTLADGVLNISGTGAMADFTSYKYQPWTAHRADIQSVEIKSGVTSIGKYAFDDCNALTSVVIPDSVTSLGSCAFYSCNNLASVTLGSGITTIGDRAFDTCPALTAVTIPAGVTSIGGRAFNGCSSLTAIAIPASVTEIGDEAFELCSGLTAITVDEDNPSYSSDDSGVLFNKNKTLLIRVPSAITGSYTIPDSVTEIADRAFDNSKTLTDVTISTNVTNIGYQAFYGCSGLTDVYYAGTQTQWEAVTIGADNTYLTGATIHYADPCAEGHSYEEGVCTVCDAAAKAVLVGFDNIDYYATLPEALKAAENSETYVDVIALADYDGDFTIPANVGFNGIGRTFQGKVTNNADILGGTFHGEVINHGEIRGGTFNGAVINNLQIEITESVTFNGKLTNNTNGVISDHCDADKYTFGENFLYVNNGGTVTGEHDTTAEATCQQGAICSFCGEYGEPNPNAHTFDENSKCTVCGADCTHETFTDGKCDDCGITGGYCGAATNEGGEESVIWTYDEVTNAFAITGTGAMEDYNAYRDRPWDGSISKNATSVTISEGVTRIGDRAFQNFTQITAVTVPASVESIGYCAFTGCEAQSITFAEGSRLTAFDDYVFQSCTALKQITLPAGVTSVDPSVFSGCNALTDIFVEEDSTTLKDIDGVLYTADGTTLLRYPIGKKDTAFTTPTGVTTIGEWAFVDNVNLKTITLSEGVTTIGEEAFRHCLALETLNLPDSLTTMGICMIASSAKLTSIALPETLTKIDEGAFACSCLTEIHIPKNVTTIGAHAFEESHNLTTVVIPQGVTTIGEQAFWWMDSLTTVTIPSSVTSIGRAAFKSCDKLTTINAPCNWNTENPLYTFDSTVAVIVGDHTPNADGYTVNENGTHSFTCDCGTEVTEEHTFDESGKCTVCGAACTHSSFADGKCTVCGIPGGYCGSYDNAGGHESLWWYIQDGTLTISGAGDMANMLGEEFTWEDLRNSITALVIDKGVTGISGNAFIGLNNLKSVTFAEGSLLTTIGNNAFENCSSLTEITIPAGVTDIVSNPFVGCTAMNNVFVASGNTAYKDIEGVLYTADGTTLLSYPYRKVPDTFITPKGVTTIGDGAFAGTLLRELELTNDLTTVGETAFYNCTKLKEITISNSVKEIDFTAFDLCEELYNVYLPCSWRETPLYDFEGVSDSDLHIDEHDLSSAVPSEDGLTHQKACSNCTYKVENENHDFNDDGVCICGQKRYSTVAVAPVANQKEIEFKGSTSFGLMYNCEEQELVTGGSAQNGTMVYSLNEEGPFAESIPTAKNAGTYQVYYKVLGDTGYCDTEAAFVTVDIMKATVILSTPDQTRCVDEDLNQLTSGFLNWEQPNYDGSWIPYPSVEQRMYTYATQGVKGTYDLFIEATYDEENYSITFETSTLTVTDHNFNENHICGCGAAETFPVRANTDGDADYEWETSMAFGSDLEAQLNAYLAENTDQAPAKTGYTFTGQWKFYLDAECEEELDGTAMPAQTVYVQSVFQAIEYTITWEMNGCDYSQPNYPQLPEKLPYNADSGDGGHFVSFATLTPPAGYDFVRFEDGDGKELDWSFTDRYRLYLTVSGDMTVKTVLEPKIYKAVWDNGEGGEYEKEFACGEIITIPDNAIFADTFRKAGYTLTGWEGYTQGMTMPVDGITFTAIYTPNNYTITFDANGGTAVAPITQPYGSAITAPVAPTREGYHFASWDAELPATMPLDGMTVKAVWEEHKDFTYTASGDTIIASCGKCSAQMGTAKVTAQGKTYDGKPVTAFVETTGALKNETFGITYFADGAALNESVINAGTYTASITHGGETAGVEFTIEKAPLTVTAKDNTITYGNVPAANGVAYSGFVNGETEAVLGGELTYTYNDKQFGNVGTYKITPAGLVSGNYEITFADGTLTVNAKSITVTAQDQTKLYGQKDPALTYKAEGLVNGDSLVGQLNRESGEAVGSYQIGQGTLTNESNPNYEITFAPGKLTITCDHSHNENTQYTPNADGENHSLTCSICGKMAVEAEAHSGGKATCTDLAACEKCGASYGEKNTANHTGNNTVVGKVEPTCGKSGYTGDTICECGELITQGKVDPATGKHTPAAAVRENEKAPTCYAEGSYDEVVYCSVCKTHKISSTPKTIEKLDHTPGKAVRENEKAPTCYAEGSYDEVVYCSVAACKQEISRTAKTLPVDPDNHTGNNTVVGKVEPTCGKSGYTGDTICECGALIAQGKVDPATGKHTPAAAVRENEKAATCYAEGSYDEVVYCSVQKCGEKLSSTPKTIAKLKHTPGKAVRENEKAPTCYAEGSYDEVTYCSVDKCKAELSRETKSVAKTQHTPAAAVREKVVEATCQKAGSYEAVVYCSVAQCKHQISRTPQTIAMLKHTETTVKGYAATCTATGLTDGVKCSACNTVLVAQNVIAATGVHSYVNSVCKHCGDIRLTVTTGNNAEGKPTLKWLAVANAARYEVYRATTENGSYVKVFTTTGRTYTHASAVAGRTYYYKLKVVTRNGTEVFSSVLKNSRPIPEAQFSIVTGHNAAGKPTLKWTAIPGADRYEVYRATSKNGEYVKAFSTKGTTYTNTSAKAGNTYYYKLKVYLTDGTEKTSEIVVNNCLIPGVQFSIVTGNNAEGKPTLKWTAIAGADHYEVYRADSENGEYVKAFSTKGTTYTNTSAKAGNTYYYKLKVYLVDGTTEVSDAISNVCLDVKA